MRRVMLIALILGVDLPGALAQDMTSLPGPAPSPAPHAVPQRLAAARLQTLLARSGFSPGLIDGRPGAKTRTALEHYQRAHELPVSGIDDEATLASLAQGDELARGAAWTRTYTITTADMNLITGPIPVDWNERATLERSGFSDLPELLAERGWCSQDLVQLLNPGVDLDALEPGQSVSLPDVPGRTLPRLARIEIDLSDKLVRGFDDDAREVSLMHCSIARQAEKRPVGELRVRVIATDPEYTFNPKDWPEIDNVDHPLKIAPGPRNPVGLAWIGLDKPGYGLHGTPRPQDIGKTGSHGCFRLCNWDAVRLAHALRVGTVVVVQE